MAPSGTPWIEVKKLEDLKEIPENYRKKPIVIRAIQLREHIVIKTREGTLVGYPSDYLVEGIEGEIYPVGKEIFEKTYEKAE